MTKREKIDQKTDLVLPLFIEDCLTGPLHREQEVPTEIRSLEKKKKSNGLTKMYGRITHPSLTPNYVIISDVHSEI